MFLTKSCVKANLTAGEELPCAVKMTVLLIVRLCKTSEVIGDLPGKTQAACCHLSNYQRR